jgi:hypothetical protein
MTEINIEKTESWIEDYLVPNHPELVPPFRSAFEGYKAIKSTNDIDEDSLDAIVKTVSCESRVLSNNSIQFLIHLVSKYDEAQLAVKKMLKDSKMHTRLSSLRALSQNTPRDFSIEILSRGLKDRSDQVRKLASYKARELNIQELIPELVNALNYEKSLDAKSEIKHNLYLLRYGFSINRVANRGLYVWFRENDGVHGKKLSINTLPLLLKIVPRLFRGTES